MNSLKDNFINKVKSLIDDPSTLKSLEILAENLIIECEKHFDIREGVIFLDENLNIVEMDSVFKEWFGIEEIRNYFDLFSDEFKDVALKFISKVKEKGFYKQKNFYLKVNDKEILVDARGERIKIENKDLIILNFRKKEVNSVEYKLSVIEEQISNIIVRIKDFEALMKEVLKIFIDSGLFDLGWVAKIDKDTKQIIPVVTMEENYEDVRFKQRMFDFSYFKGILDMLVIQDAVIIENIEFEGKKYKKGIVFPIYKKWEYSSSDEIGYAVLVYSEENCKFSNDEFVILKEIVYKINLAITDIFIKEKANVIISTDTLTNLPKREVFISEIKKLIKDKTLFAIALIDIDKLKKVNDVLGFWAGDKAIKKLSTYLREKLNKSFVARIGSDEFGVLIKGNKKEIYNTLDEILSFNDDIVQINGSGVFLPVSVGVSFFPDDGMKEEDLILLAESALSDVKKRGGKGIGYANKHLKFLPKDYLELEKELKEAIKNDEYVMYYQPIIDIKKNKVWGVEALLRWKSKKRGLVSPSKFIPILEESGLINEVGDIIMDKVLEDAKEFESIKFSFSMNISVTQLLSQNIALKLINKIKEKGVKKENIIVEITESVLMENIDVILPQIDLLEKEGIRIEIDDFGTGYSSLSYLKKLPVSALKVDRSFVKDLVNDEEDKLIVSAIISMAKAMHKQTIAEGVETKEVLELLKALGVDYVQGYYFAKPMPKEELRKFLAL
ncbi:putative bifunctional diguanylate cyclase/phosphodiesterase [Caminibacter sp.]